MTGINFLRFLSMIFTAVTMSAALAHLFALPHKIRMARETYLLVQQIYRGWNLIGIAVVGALVSTAALSVSARKQTREFRLTLAAAFCVAAGLALFFLLVYPANRETLDWTVAPENWRELRRHWEYGHAAGAGSYFAAFVLLTVSLLPGSRRSLETLRTVDSRIAAMTAALIAAATFAAAGPAFGEGGKCAPTPKDMEGPFYKPGAPELRSTGSGLAVSGNVLSYPDCRPIQGARVEWWHADRSGRYVDSLRGAQKTGAEGAYAFTTSPPGIYPGRPAHIHFKVFAPGRKPLTTQLYLNGGEKDVKFDLVVEAEGR